MGLNDEDLKNYMVGVAAAWNEAGPCNIHVLSLANHPKDSAYFTMFGELP